MRAILTLIIGMVMAATVACALVGAQDPGQPEGTRETELQATREIESAVKATVEAWTALQAQNEQKPEAETKQQDAGTVTQAREGTRPTLRPEARVQPTRPLPAKETADATVDCDAELKRRLKSDRRASQTHWMQQVVRAIQAEASDCTSSIWNPKVVDVFPGRREECVSPASGIDKEDIPAGLGSADGNIRSTSWRDRENNVIVHWSERRDERPHDGAICWLYLAGSDRWMTGAEEERGTTVRRTTPPPGTPWPTPAGTPVPTLPPLPINTPAPEPTAMPTPTQTPNEPGTSGTHTYRDPDGVFTFRYPTDCGRMTEGMGPDNSRVAGNENNCPGNDGEIDVELETYDLTDDDEELPLSPESAAEQVANALASLTDDAHRETLTTESGDTLEIVRNELEAWGDDKIVVVTAIHVSAGWQATDIIMSYWASGEEDPNWERVLESLRTFSTGVKDGN